MKVLKFGGISVGTASRMHALVDLIKNDDPKIVVLSAMSGTTNSLVAIANALFEKDSDKAESLIDALEKQYQRVIMDLYKTNMVEKAAELIKIHFDYIRNFTKDLFTAHEEKAVLAEGELLSTALFHYYLEEIGV